MQCIYCKDAIDDNNSSVEHVFPRSFGCPDTWTIDCVCRKCNNELGGTIERRLAGDSMEGLWRLQRLGSRSKKPIKQERIKIRVSDEERYGEFKGIILYADFSQVNSLYMPAQVVTIKESGQREHDLIEDMSDDDIRNIPGRFGLYAHNESEYNQAVDRFKRLGKKFDEEIQNLPHTAINNDGRLEVEVEGMMDVIIFRTIAKIGFNYLAKSKGYEYAINKRFDVIRDYIHSGIKPPVNPVRIQKGHILAEETKNKYFLEGHIFTVETKGSQIISKVCLTNSFNFYYVVTLGDIGIIWHDIKSGHAYSLKDDEIIPLFTPTYLTIASRLKKAFGLSLRS
jgi:hypothetical protein